MTPVPKELDDWTEWRPLRDSARWAPSKHGLYRIRRVAFDGVDYIGQTSGATMSLRVRLGMLSGAFKNVMPYADPHVASPGLWALRHESGCEFEASVTVVEGTVQYRKGLEAAAITRDRLATGRSPTLNFGRMPAGYRKSSPNNARLVAAGRRYRGGPSDAVEASHSPGVPPLPSTHRPPAHPRWGELSWSAWASPTTGTPTAPSLGLYRLRRPGSERLVYVGEGTIANRVACHLTTGAARLHHQAEFFKGQLECSWVAGNWLRHQRLELENDLVGIHVLRFGDPPAAQFLG